MLTILTTMWILHAFCDCWTAQDNSTSPGQEDGGSRTMTGGGMVSGCYSVFIEWQQAHLVLASVSFAFFCRDVTVLMDLLQFPLSDCKYRAVSLVCVIAMASPSFKHLSSWHQAILNQIPVHSLLFYVGTFFTDGNILPGTWLWTCTDSCH